MVHSQTNQNIKYSSASSFKKKNMPMRIFAHFAFLVYGLSGPFLLVLRPLHCRSSSVTTVETAVCLKMMTLSCMVASGSPLWLRVANVSPL